MLDGIVFGKWKMEYNVFEIDENKSLKDQIWELNEDIIQAVYDDGYGNHYVLDIGWYPEFDIKGHFTIYIIKNFDWETPLLRIDCGILDFRGSLQECIGYVDSL